MVSIEQNDIDPLKRRGSRFHRRQQLVTELWNQGNHEEALRATRHRYAEAIYTFYQEDPDVTEEEIARRLGNKTRQFVSCEIIDLIELGIPLLKPDHTAYRKIETGVREKRTLESPVFKDTPGLFRLDK